MENNDGHLPEDVRDIAERLTAARADATPLELDKLRVRVTRRAQRAPRRGLAGALRARMLAVGLAAGLMLTTGVGVVLASESLGGQDNNIYQSYDLNSDHSTSCVSEHQGYWSYSQSWKTKYSTVYLTVLWDCKHLTYTIKCGSGFKYKLGGGSWYDVKGTSYSDSVPPQPSGIYIQADGTNINVPFNWQ